MTNRRRHDAGFTYSKAGWGGGRERCWLLSSARSLGGCSPCASRATSTCPHAGPAIIAANHLSFFDHVALVLSAGRRMRFIGKVDYLDSWKTRFVLPALGMIPVDRDNPRRALGALAQAAEVLRADELFAIYPEGTRSRDGSLHAGHTGVGLLSVDTGVSVVPTGIIGTNHIQPPGARFPRPFRPAVVRFGAPIDPATYRGTRREVSAKDHQRRDAGHRRTHRPASGRQTRRS